MFAGNTYETLVSYELMEISWFTLMGSEYAIFRMVILFVPFSVVTFWIYCENWIKSFEITFPIVIGSISVLAALLKWITMSSGKPKSLNVYFFRFKVTHIALLWGALMALLSKCTENYHFYNIMRADLISLNTFCWSTHRGNKDKNSGVQWFSKLLDT